MKVGGWLALMEGNSMGFSKSFKSTDMVASKTAGIRTWEQAESWGFRTPQDSWD